MNNKTYENPPAIVNEFPELFAGLGKLKWEPINCTLILMSNQLLNLIDEFRFM